MEHSAIEVTIARLRTQAAQALNQQFTDGRAAGQAWAKEIDATELEDAIEIINEAATKRTIGTLLAAVFECCHDWDDEDDESQSLIDVDFEKYGYAEFSMNDEYLLGFMSGVQSPSPIEKE
jgi:hypothetical protein